MDVTEDKAPAPPVDIVTGTKEPQKHVENVHNGSTHAGSQSEAETEILSEKEDGLKKQKRKTIKLEQADSSTDVAISHSERANGVQSPSHTANPLKRKRVGHEPTGSDPQDEQDSSRLSSPALERRTSVDTDHSESSPPFDDTNHRPDAESKSEKADSHGSKEANKDTVNGRKRRETRSATDFDETTNRSTSPPPRKPQRALSSQANSLPSQSSKRRRKAPAPLQVDRRNRPSEDPQDSDSSSIRSHVRDQPLKSADINMGVWKSSKHTTKKNKDRSGRTLLARACALSLEETEKWLEERHEDIDVADYAGNTPLQIASLHGHADIVKLLIGQKCKTDCKNVDNDTPLIDAVENGHLDVVRLLLDAGVDPTQRNALGKEPIELVDPELDEADEIRAVIEQSKKVREKKVVPDDHDRRQNSASGDLDTSSNVGTVASPSHSTRSPPLDASNRRRTARSQHTDDSLLWVNPTPQRLRDAAGKGEMTIVDHILRMRPHADTETVLAAAQGGHDEVLGMILAIAQPEADPPPLKSGDTKPGHSTPMLASIGRGNTKVIKLLLDQPGFNPTRRLYKNLTYHELAKERRSSNWQEEYEVLKEAYDQHKRHGGRKSNQSTPHRIRVKRDDSRKSPLDLSSSPPHEAKKLRKAQSDDKDERESQVKKKRASPGLLGKMSDDRRSATASSDQELDIARRKEKKSLSRVRSASPSHEMPVKPKRRLVSGNDFKSDREPRRKALAPESLQRRKSGESVDGQGERRRRPSDSANSVRILNQAISESPGRAEISREDLSKKRFRSSVSPRNSRTEAGDIVKKKKRLRTDSNGASMEKESKASPSFGLAPPATMVPASSDTSTSVVPQPPGPTAPVAFMGSSQSSPAAFPPGKRTPSDPQEVTKGITSEDRCRQEPPAQQNHENHVTLSSPFGLDIDLTDPDEVEEEQEVRLREEEEQRIVAELRHKEEAALQAKRQKEMDDAEQAARTAREEELARQEEERRLQRERDAAEAEAALARKQREEELQKRRLEQEKQRREDQERRRREAEEREALRLMRAQQEEERQRREALPHGLRRYVELSPDEARLPREISRWLPLRTVTSQDFDPSCDSGLAEERWIANVQAAPLLANKDLELSQYTAWSRRPAEHRHCVALWRQLRNPMSQAIPLAIVSPLEAYNLELETRPKFFALNIFWIKLSDFMDIVPRHSHLTGLKLTTRDFVLDWPISEGAMMQNHQGIKEEAGASPPSVNGVNGTLVNGHR